MNDLTKLAFVDELVKIGTISEETAELILKEAGLRMLAGAAKKAFRPSPAAGRVVSPERMAAMKAQWKAGAPSGGAGATLRRSAPSARLTRPSGGAVGSGSFIPQVSA
jgi:hypothetical protein